MLGAAVGTTLVWPAARPHLDAARAARIRAGCSGARDGSCSARHGPQPAAAGAVRAQSDAGRRLLGLDLLERSAGRRRGRCLPRPVREHRLAGRHRRLRHGGEQGRPVHRGYATPRDGLRRVPCDLPCRRRHELGDGAQQDRAHRTRHHAAPGSCACSSPTAGPQYRGGYDGIKVTDAGNGGETSARSASMPRTGPTRSRRSVRTSSSSASATRSANPTGGDLTSVQAVSGDVEYPDDTANIGARGLLADRGLQHPGCRVPGARLAALRELGHRHQGGRQQQRRCLRGDPGC